MERLPLTADLCARAIVASCASYGDDPIRAVQVRQGILRRGVAPGALAVIQATGVLASRVERMFRLSPSGCSKARCSGGVGFERALTAALGAIGGARLVLAPVVTAATPPRRPDPETYSGYTDALLEPRPNLGAPVDVGVVTSEPVAPPVVAALPAPVARAPSAPLFAVRREPPSPVRAPRPAAAPQVFTRFAPRVADPPVRESAAVTAEERALIDSAIAAGKVRQVVDDGSSELVFDVDRHAYTRLPKTELELVPEHGWKKASAKSDRGRRAATAMRKAKALSTTVAAS